MDIVKFEFNGTAVDFEPTGKDNVMVNATQMGKIFGKLPKDFLKNENTKSFLEECLKKENSPFLGIEKEEDLIISKQNSGTWMHRILALKFAAWLDPKFELFVYATIDQLLFGESIKRKQMISRKAEIRLKKATHQKNLQENEDFIQLQELAAEEMRLGKELGKLDSEALNGQLKLFE